MRRDPSTLVNYDTTALYLARWSHNIWPQRNRTHRRAKLLSRPSRTGGNAAVDLVDGDDWRHLGGPQRQHGGRVL